MTVGAIRLNPSNRAPCRPTIRSGRAFRTAPSRPASTGGIVFTPAAGRRRYPGSASPGATATTGRSPSASVTSSVSSVSVAGRSAWPGTFDSPFTCCTFSGRAVSLRSSKPDSWQPSANAARAARSRRTGNRTAGISSDPMNVLALFGPTGVGKTAVAIAVAERLRQGGEDPVAVSADALQVYAGLPILTGSADAHEQTQLEHRLLGFVPIDETYSAGAFAQHAHATIDDLIAHGRRPIVVGGTGLYLR